MQTLFIEKDITYHGRQLAPHWIYKNHGLLGDAIVSFIGKADVKIEEMVDIEDVINNEPIYSEKMAHFIIERFNLPLEQAVVEQRFFVSIIKDVLESYGIKVNRKGDDLFFDNRKLSVSIATKSITSCLIHTALNVVSDGAPIPVSNLTETGITNVPEFCQKVMEQYKNEIIGIKKAACKVRGVV